MNSPIPEELRGHLALALVPELGPRRTAKLLQHFGDPAKILTAREADLARVELIGPSLAARFVQSFRQVDVEAEWNLMQRHGVRVILLGDPAYPAALAGIENPPPLLYCLGELSPADAQAVGIVGSRSCTSYGKRITQQICRELAQRGWTVISGLARGIDGIAHEATLDAGGRTIAVLAGGLSKIYPPEHADLAQRIREHGALLSETPMTVAPQAGMFPARNRIVSALSRGVVIVEANVKSGALITASHAADQGREVFAVPGNVDSPASAGCLELIRQGARLVRHAADILEDFIGLQVDTPARVNTVIPKRLEPPATLFDESVAAETPSVPITARPLPELTDAEAKIWDVLDSPRHADELARETGLPSAELVVVLMKLQMRKLIARRPGNFYERAL